MASSATRLIQEKPQTRQSSVETSWRLAVLASLISFVATASFRSSGIMYVLLIDEFKTSRMQASWPMMVLGSSIHASGLAVGILQQHISIYKIAVIGSIFVWVSILAAAFAPSLIWMSVTYGFGQGFGTGVTVMALSLIILESFVEYRGIATGIQYAGGATSGLFFPKFLILLHKEYGFRGMLLITGGLVMHATLLSLLLKPSRSLGKRVSPEKSPALTRQAIDNAVAQNAVESLCERVQKSFSPLLPVFVKPTFYAIFCSSVLIHYSQHVFTATNVDFAIDKGAHLWKAALVPVCSCGSDVFGRVLLPLLADRNYLRSCSLVMYCHFFLGLSMMLLAQVSSFALLLSVSMVVAMFLACVITMKTVLMADYFGVDAVSVCYWITGLGVLPFFISNPLIVGYFRDSMGSYDNLYRLVGGLNILVSLVLGLSACCERSDQEGDKTVE